MRKRTGALDNAFRKLCATKIQIHSNWIRREFIRLSTCSDFVNKSFVLIFLSARFFLNGRLVKAPIQNRRMVRLNASIFPSLSETVTENLRRRNVITIVDFVSTDSIKLASFTGLSHADVLEVKQHILKKFGGTKRNASQLLAIERGHVIPTIIDSLDELLRGGLYPGQLCELCGPSASGKTQLCLTIAANVANRSDIVVWYFDTKKDFSRLRYEGIMRAKNFGQKEQSETSFGERKTLLVIIDSLPAIIFKLTRNEQQSDSKTTYELDDLAEICRFLTQECQAVVITVNSVTRWNSPGQTNSADITPALGKYWVRIPATRLLITRQHGETRKITVWKDLRLIENSFCTVTVSDIGIRS